MAETWHLYLDESGRSNALSKWFVLGGVLLRADGELASLDLRAQLSSAMPGLRYPPHASECNMPAGRLVHTLLAERAGVGVPEAVRILCTPAEKALHELGTATARKVLDALDRSWVPEYDLLRVLNLELNARFPTEFASLKALVSQDQRGMCALLRSLGRQLKGHAFGVGAATRADWLAFDDDRTPGRASPSPYLSLLETTFERILSQLRSQTTVDCTVWTTVAVLDIERSGYPALPLTQREVGEAIARAVQFPFRRAEGLGDGSVRIVPRGVFRFDEHVPAGIVLADYVANRLRRAIRGTTRTGGWTALQKHARSTLTLPLEGASRAFDVPSSLPWLAADGAARVAICEAFQGDQANEDGLTAGWERDQAQLWVRAANHWRQRGGGSA